MVPCTERLFRRHVDGVTPAAVRCFVRKLASAEHATIDRSHPAMRAAFSAYQAGFGALPIFLRSGGTIPVIAMLRDILRMQTVLMGFALPDDQMHAADEKLYLPSFFNGIAASIHFLEGLADRLTATRHRPAPAASRKEGI